VSAAAFVEKRTLYQVETSKDKAYESISRCVEITKRSRFLRPALTD